MDTPRTSLLRSGLLAGMALAAGCTPPVPRDVWFPRAEHGRTGQSSCAPPELIQSACESVAVPSSPREGPRLVFGDTIGFGPMAVDGNSLYYTLGPPGLASEVCRMSVTGGPPLCFASVDPNRFLDLRVDGAKLLGLVSRSSGDDVLARIDRERGDVEYRVVTEEEEWAIAFDAGPDVACVLLGRPGPGHAERALAVVPLGSGPRTLIVPFGVVQRDAMACDGESAYFVGPFGLARVPLRGGESTVLGTSAYRIALGAKDVYVAGARGIERLPKGSTTLTLVAPVAHSGMGWDPVRELRAVPGGVAWRERTFPNRSSKDVASAVRRCLEQEGCETLAESREEMRLAAEGDGVLYWTRPTKSRYGTIDGLYAARGPATLGVAGD